jgi:hypothetical protein
VIRESNGFLGWARLPLMSPPPHIVASSDTIFCHLYKVLGESWRRSAKRDSDRRKIFLKPRCDARGQLRTCQVPMWGYYAQKDPRMKRKSAAKAVRQDDAKALTIPELAAQWRCGETLLYRLTGSGALESFTVGRCRRVALRAARDFIRRHSIMEATNAGKLRRKRLRRRNCIS